MLKMRRLVLNTFLLAATAALAAAQSDSGFTKEGAFWVRTINGTVTARALERLRVDTVGSVELRGSGNDSATYTLKVRVRARDAREAESIQRQMEVKSGTEDEWAYLSVRPGKMPGGVESLSLVVPRSLRQTRIETRGGNVDVFNLEGDLQARSGGGRIHVDGIRGRSDLRTGGGDIEVGLVMGSVRCLSGGGNIHVDNAAGDCSVETAGGEILIRQAGGLLTAATAGGNIRVEHAAAAVTARTAGGLIQVQHAEGPVIAESAGGAIQVNEAKGVRCESAAGAIRLRNVAGALHASASAGSILAELLAGNQLADSSLSANAGDITVVIPSTLPVTVEARNESGGSGRIMSDFPQIRLQASANVGGGPAVAEGTLNGGGPILRISVMGGTIYLRREK